jgi:Protein of unknown function (DUF3164)
MTHETETIPRGYWQDATGALIPLAKIKEIDKLRHAAVTQLCEAAKISSADLLAFKLQAMQALQEFVDKSLAAYEVSHGGKKGNITLISFDGRYKIVRQMQESITFDERLQAAKALIDDCVKMWSKGSNDNIKVLINDAFQVDKQGAVSTGRVLRLRSLKIEDPQWHKAMQAIADSMKATGSKAYIRFYERVEATGEYQPISLDVAGV